MNTSEREVIITRTVKAPRALVFNAWTDPVHLEHWCGPDGFVTNTISVDFRVGGQWKFTMTGPDGTVFPNLVMYEEISPVERIGHDHGEREDDVLFEATITFVETNGGTLITMRSLFLTKEARDPVWRNPVRSKAVSGRSHNWKHIDNSICEGC